MMKQAIPAERSTFVGRERDLASLRDMLSRSALITIAGPPGIGKTRLAQRFASGVAPSFADGASFIDLAGAGAGDSLALLIGEQLGLELRDRPLQALLVSLASRQALLVVDNCEQVVEEAASVCGALLAHCPNLKLLATSREPLRIDGEAIWQLAPFDAPANGANLHAFRSNDCVALFADRAASRRPGFDVDAANRDDIASICRQVDGVPLALELAATLVDAMSLQEIATGLGQSLGLLVRGKRTVERHRSVRASILWSYSLLDDSEREALRRLSLVPGELDVPTAAALMGFDEAPMRSIVLQLIEKSLVLAAPAPEMARYRLLEPIRQFAFEMLVAAGEEESTRSRHLAHFEQRAAEAEPVLMSGRREPALKKIVADLHHVRAALSWGLRSDEPDERARAARLVANLLWFWAVSGFLTEGMQWLKRAAAVEPPLSLETRARVLYAGGELAWLLGEESVGRSWLEESTAIWRQLGNQLRVAYCDQALSFLVEPELGRELAAESIQIFEASGEEWGYALAIHTLGLLESQRGHAGAGRANLEEGARRYEKLGDTYLLVQALNLLGDLDRNQCDYELAGRHYAAALAVLQATQYRALSASIVQNLGFVSFHLGQPGEALERFREAAQLFVNLGDRRGVAESLLGIATVLTADGAVRPAATLLGASNQILAEANAEVWRSNRDDAEWTARELRLRLGESEFDDAVGRGASLSLAEAVAMATDLKQLLSPRRGIDSRGAPLSRRELEVALLVARGYRNRQIAEELVISEATAGLHVKHILRRLGFHSRVEIVRWVSARGLLSEQTAK